MFHLRDYELFELPRLKNVIIEPTVLVKEIKKHIVITTI